MTIASDVPGLIGVIVLMLICAVGGFYAKGTVYHTIVYAIVAPVILVGMAFIVAFALGAIVIPFQAVFPGLSREISTLFSELPHAIQVIFHPITLVLFSLFGIVCHSERKSRGLSNNYTPAVKCHSPLIRKIRF